MSTSEAALTGLLDKLMTPAGAVASESVVRSLLPEGVVVSSLLHETDNLARVIKTQEQLSEVKKSLCSIVDSIADNPSFFTRASELWGSWPLWQKVGSGIVLTAPAIVVGLVANINSLLLIGSVSAVMYSSTGMILEDHHACNVTIRQRLKDGILSITDVLELTIAALDTIRNRLAEEVQRFNSENNKLVGHVLSLERQIDSLTAQVQCLAGAEESLRATRDQLQKTVMELEQSVDKQSELLKKNQEELTAVTRDYQRNQEHLAAEVAKLKATREDMSRQMASTARVSTDLRAAVDTMSSAVRDDKKQRQELQEKLQVFFAAGQVSFDHVTKRLTETEQKFEETVQHLQIGNQRYDTLLSRQLRQQQFLERLELDLQARTQREQKGETRAADSHGLFAGSRPVVVADTNPTPSAQTRVPGQ